MLRSDAFLRGVPTLNTDAAGAAPPDAFGPFRVLHQIGAGALGPVFRAYQPEQDRLVAVKLFRLDLPPERVHTLVRALASIVAADLTHPAIAAPIAAGLVDASAYLAQDFVAAESLDVVIRGGDSSSPAEVLRIATAIAGALDCAAERNILHGALHPRDVMVSNDDVRITGLGIARALEEVGIHTPVRRPYSAPERAVGGPWDGRADMFSFAALMFELLFGRRVSGAGERAVASLPEIPGTDRAALKRVMARALAGDPGGRFPTGMAFVDALASALTTAQTPLPMMPVDDDRTVMTTPRIVAPQVEEAPVRESTRLESPAELHLTEPEPEPVAESPLLPLDAPDFEIAHGGRADVAALGLSPVDHLDLRSASRSEEVEADTEAPELSATVVRQFPPARDNTLQLPPVPPPASFTFAAQETARSAVWPIGLALAVGIVIGFGLALALIGRGGVETVPSSSTTAQVERATSTPIVEEPVIPTGDASPRVSPPAAPVASTPAAAPDTGQPATAAPTPAATAPAPAPEPAVAPPAPPAAVAGRILVRTTPAGARVSIDGKNAGTTPLTALDIPRGVHTVRITRDGYVAEERRVTVTAARPAPTVSVSLERESLKSEARPAPPASAASRRPAAPAAVSGSLVVDSRPTGASVYLDGQLAGRTPLLLDEVSATEHSVRLELAGYKRWASSVKIVAGERARVAASLEQ